MAKSDEFICVHSVKRDGEMYAPGSPIVIVPGPELERLLELGAVVPVPEYARREQIRAERRGAAL